MNQKGQAMIEASILMTLCVFPFVFLLQFGLHFISEIIVDDLLEQTLICKIQQQSNCITNLRSKLLGMNYKNIHITDHSQAKIARISVSWKSTNLYSGTLESELSLDLSVP